jgi:hypothetical protein
MLSASDHPCESVDFRRIRMGLVLAWHARPTLRAAMLRTGRTG